MVTADAEAALLSMTFLNNTLVLTQSIFIIYREISPQYHSASVSRLLVSVMADGAIFDLAGFAGRTGNKHGNTQKSQETAKKKYRQV